MTDGPQQVASDGKSALVIDIFSDVMCPWCLIGWGQLSKALDQLSDTVIAEIRWHAFELNPDMPDEGEERVAHIARKYGRTAEQAAAVVGQMAQAAEDAGVSLDYAGETENAPPAMMWNTFAAHKLLHWALAEHGAERQTELKLALFAAHFHHRRRIGKCEVLLDIAEETGFDRAGAAAALDDRAIGEAVRADEQQAYAMNITGVPAMIFDGKFMVPGAQGAETYVNVIERVLSKRVS
ncbi:DsbA family oxidoreductase [Altererythrobacter aurantiacus]|uniref:DsbA family oxidoreductase n=1 Tax=Parapontixanthobacter aurantiacus TaxID=1463599 RepID=A0A844ZIZ9_9SPHN|nr:DsbA family oxidoreductase [Parapontixanthobacter aurantiacus]MXO85689.1 DsbA family oxidoreductase [Parapontixanthobacter aurantiacus]